MSKYFGYFYVQVGWKSQLFLYICTYFANEKNISHCRFLFAVRNLHFLPRNQKGKGGDGFQYQKQLGQRFPDNLQPDYTVLPILDGGQP